MSLAELLQSYGTHYFQALLSTWYMTILAYLAAMLVAILVTVMRICPFRPLRTLGNFYTQIFRNIPGVALLVFIVYALPNLQIIFDYRSCVIVTTILVASSFASENFMSGINTIRVGEIEAARSVGLSFLQVIRHIVIPQALRASVPTMTNLLIGVMLTTALGSQVPLKPEELTGVVSYINTRTPGGIATFLISAVGYAATAFVIGLLGNRLDKRVRILR